MRWLLAASALLGSPLLVGCTDGPRGLDRFADGPALIGILVQPDEVVVPVGSDVQLEATGLRDDRTSADLTALVRWGSDDPGVARVSDDLDAEGVLRGVDVGRTLVWARLDGIESPPVSVTVSDGEIEALSVEPSRLTVEVGQSVPLTASARWSDGTVAGATGLVRWLTDDPQVAVIDHGKLLAQGEGTTTIHAEFEDIASADVTVQVVRSASADLRITDLSTWVDDDRITVTVDVENRGDAGASAFWVDVFLDPNGTPRIGDTGDDFDLVNWIGAHETKTLTFTLRDVDQGQHEVHVLVDTNDDVDEADEADNHDSHDLTLDGTLWPADIVVDDFDWVGDGWYVYYWIELSNYGDEPTGPFYLDLYLDRTNAPPPGVEGDYYVDVGSIDPWSTLAFEVAVELQCYDCWSWIQADSLDEIPEIYEDDNVAGPLFVFN
jgi:hypothetical protein